MRLESAPLLLTAVRAVLAPLVVLLSLFAPRPSLFAVCLIVALVSDIFDGVWARRLGVATAFLRRLDSVADTLFYVGCVFAAWHLYPDAIRQRLVSLELLAGLEVARYAFDYAKFKREASYHMWSSKIWGLALFAGFISLLVFGSNGAAVTIAIYIGIAADIEGLIISFLLPHWQAVVPSFVHAARLRRE